MELQEQCAEISALLSEYLNLELPPDACGKVEGHLAGCDTCVEFAASLRRTVELCRQYQPSELPGPIAQKAREDLLAAYRKSLPVLD